MKLLEKLYYKMLLIRKFEELLFDLFEKGMISGTTHTYIGQEATGVSLIENLKSNDIIISNHRCHGHYLSKTGDVIGLLSEILGKKDGICKGRGGSQHLHSDSFFSNGVQGNMFPVSAGISLAEKFKESTNLTVVFMGDGTLGQGVIYETLNMIGLYKLPILVIVENNQYAQSTPINENFAGNIKDRLNGFSIEVEECESTDVEYLYLRYNKLIKDIRSTKSPRIDIIHNERLGPHSKGDDDRPDKILDQIKKLDPIRIMNKKIDLKIQKKIEAEVTSLINKSLDKVLKMENSVSLD